MTPTNMMQSRCDSSGRDPAGAQLILGYSQPAMIVSMEGKLLRVNQRGGVLTDFVAPKLSEPLDQILATAQSGVVASATSNHPKSHRVFELTAIPVDSERVLILGREVGLHPQGSEEEGKPFSRFKNLIEISSDLVWETDENGAFSYVSPRGAFGYRAEDLMGRKPEDLLATESELIATLFRSREQVDGAEIKIRKADGKSAWIQVHALPLWAEDGSWLGLRGMYRDVTVEREKDALLVVKLERDKVLDRIVSAFRDQPNPEAMLETAAGTIFNTLKPAGLVVYRYDATGNRYLAASRGGNPDEHRITEKLPTTGGLVQLHKTKGLNVLMAAIRYHNRDNGVLCLWRSISDQLWNRDDQSLIGSIANQLGIVLEQLAHHEQVLELSRTDALTGLLNRRAFIDEEVPRRVKRLQRSGQGATLLYLDLDDFKEINDLHGHQLGDEALLAVRDIFLQHTRPGDLTARLGGDEFVIWLDNIGAETAIGRAKQLLAATKKLKRFSGSDGTPLGLSIGIASFDPDRDETLDQLLARADAAMYEAKKKGKRDYSVSPLDLR